MTRWLVATIALFLSSCAPVPAGDFEPARVAPDTVVCPAVPAELDFGRIPVGGEATRVLPELRGSLVATSAPGASVVDRDGTPALTVRPTALGAWTGEATVSTPSCGEARVRLAATAEPACLRVAAAARFADTERSCGSSELPLDVENTCDAAVQLVAASVEERVDLSDSWCPGGAPCTEFGVVAGQGLIAPGSTTTLTARFKPAGAGERAGMLQLRAAERDGSLVYPVTLSGVGVARALVSEHLDAPPPLKGDLLLIVDTSPSMAARATSTLENLRVYAHVLALEALDLTITIAAAERGAAGASVATLSSRAPDFEVRFGEALAALPRGTEDTSCLTQAVAHLEAATTIGRPGLPAAVVCITDGPDRAPGSWSELMGRFTSRLGTPRIAVVGPFSEVPGCLTELDDGRLAALAANGVREDICAPNWWQILNPFSVSAFGYFTWFPLSRPALRIVDVTVEGLELPPSLWDWDTAMNAIRLSVLAALEPGQRLDVTYEPSCP